MQRRPALAISLAHVCTLSQEHPNHVRIAIVRCSVQGRQPALMSGLQRGTCPYYLQLAGMRSLVAVRALRHALGVAEPRA